MKELIKATREYIDYIEEHYDNVQKAWSIVQEKCSDIEFIANEENKTQLTAEILRHDISKLTAQEFIQYRNKFFPTSEIDVTAKDILNPNKSVVEIGFENAWEHHKTCNFHHWQTWTTIQDERYQKINCVHMVVDWMAMGMKFNSTAKDYYEKNKNDIKIPEWAVEFIYEIFNRVY